MEIRDYLDPNLITHLHTDSREEAIRQLVNLADAHGKIIDREKFTKALFEREAVVSTGIGLGVAIPHVRLPEYDAFFLAIGICDQDIPWDAIDQMPVRLVVLLAGPSHLQGEYLQLLSSITQQLKDEETRKEIFTQNSLKEIIQLLSKEKV